MGILSKLFSIKSADPSDAIYRALVDASARTAAGVMVSPETAMRCAPVFAAVRIRCETLAQLPVNMFKRKRDGGREKAVNHPLHAMLHDAANGWTPAFNFISDLERDATLHGNGYAYANRVRGRIFELIRLDPRTVAVEVDKVTQEPSYRVNSRDGQKNYEWTEVLHVTGFGGESAIRNCSGAIGLCLALEDHAARILSNGGRPSGLLTTKLRLTEKQLTDLKEAWNTQHAGDNSGKTAIISGGFDFVPMGFKSVDMEFQAQRAFQITEIARAIGVPPALIADYGRATWSNSEQMAQHFLTFSMLPRVKAWQGAIARLLSAKERAEYYPEFMVDELVKADIAARFEAYQKAISARILNPNEVRAKENLPAYPGGDEFMNPNIETPAAPTKQTPALALRSVS